MINKYKHTPVGYPLKLDIRRTLCKSQPMTPQKYKGRTIKTVMKEYKLKIE